MKKIFINAIIAVLLIMVIGTFYGCKKIEIIPIELSYGHYELRYEGAQYDLMSFDQDIINGQDKGVAMEHILQVADTNLQNANCVARISLAEGNAYTGGIGGNMVMRMLLLKQNDSYYYESAGSLYEANPAAGLQAGKVFVDQASREYSGDLQTFYKQNPKHKGKPAMIEEFPYFSIDYSKAKLETTEMEDREDVEYFGKLTNFVFNKNTVKLDLIIIDYSNTLGFYTLTFELNLEDEDARNEATEVPRENLRKAGSDDLEYIYYKYSMEIWDNGLIRTVTANESWLGTVNVFFLSLTGSSESTVKDYYSWHPDDSSYISKNWI